MRYNLLLTAIVSLLAVQTIGVQSTRAVAPTPEAVAKWKAEGVWNQKVADWKAFKAAGGCAPADHSPFKTERYQQRISLDANAVDTAHIVDTFHVLVILVDFPDFAWDGQGTFDGETIGNVAADSAMFDSLLGSFKGSDIITNTNGSFTDYFFEVSYGRLFMDVDIVDWLRMPQNYSNYVGSDDGRGSGGQLLAGHAIDAAEASGDGVDYSLYDNDGDNIVEGVIIVHAGPGAETDVYGIWSHRSSTFSRAYDGVLVGNYTLNPEEQGNGISSMGVYCHEYGHVFALEDLYGFGDNGANGLGVWSLMSSGNWINGGKSPSHLDAWSKYRAGFLDLVWIDENQYQTELPQVETNPVAYGLIPKDADIAASNQFWVVENRQRVGFDSRLPGSGLLIFHVDPGGSQFNPNRYRVDLEQADGRRDLNTGANNGDSRDPWPGSSGNPSFSTFSTPNSLLNGNGDTSKVAVWNINGSGASMFADLDVEFSRPWALLNGFDSVKFSDVAGGNSNGILDQGETIDFNITVRNFGRPAFSSVATLTVDNPEIQIVQNDVPLISYFNSFFDVGFSQPIQFFIPPDMPSSFVNFTITIATDSLINVSGTGEFLSIFEFPMVIGRPEILLVDDDLGKRFEKDYAGILNNLGFPHEIWEKQIAGSPAASDLSRFKHVIWFNGFIGFGGDNATLTSADVSAMKGFLDGGGNLLLSSVLAMKQLAELDSPFVANYLHTNVGEQVSSFFFVGYDGVQISENTQYEISSGVTGMHDLLMPVNGGIEAFILTPWSGLPDVNLGNGGVIYDGAYKTVTLSFGIEFLTEGRVVGGQVINNRDTLVARVLSFFSRGTATALDDEIDDLNLPTGFSLAQNYPNPFNPATTISYTITAADSKGKLAARTNLSVFNLLGQKVITLVDRTEHPGSYSIVWDGRNARGRTVSTGIYFYRLTHGNKSETRKMLFLQ